MSTLVAYADVADGIINSVDGGDSAGFDGVYAPARAGTGNPGLETIDTTSTVYRIGQEHGNGNEYQFYAIWEYFFSFDTSPVGAGSTVSAAVLNLTSEYDGSVQDFTIEARLQDWGASVTGADWVAGADLSGKTLLAHRDTSSGFVASTAYDFTDDALPSNVNKSGMTRLLMCSSRQASGSAPTSNTEVVDVRGADQGGTTNDPKLTVTYSGPTTFTSIGVMLGGGL